MTTQKQTQSAAAAPAAGGLRFDAFQVEDAANGQKSYWTRVGVAFPHADGKGFNLVLRALPLDGKVVLRQHEPKSTDETR